MNPRSYAAGAAAAAAFSTALTAVTALATPAQALPPTSRTVDDPVEPGRAYDIVAVTLRAAPRADRPAVIKVTHGREVAFGDALDVWFDLDGDKVPDLHLSGSAFSEYVVRKAKSFTQDGRDVSERDCVRLSMAGTTSKVRLFPACVDAPRAYAVSVRSSTDGEPERTDDWTPGPQRFTKKVLAAPIS